MQRFLPLIALLALTACSQGGAAPSKVDLSQDCLTLSEAEAGPQIMAALPTDAGMHALWDPQSFRNVCSFEAWEQVFLKNDGMLKAIRAGSFVPIYIHSDGTPLIDLRIGTRAHPRVFGAIPHGKIMRQSRPFLFVSQGHVAVSGIEYIGGDTRESTRVIQLSAGRWSAVIAEVEIQEGISEKESETVPNFIVLLNPERAPAPVYAQTEETFQ